jgi:hypothetical protein
MSRLSLCIVPESSSFIGNLKEKNFPTKLATILKFLKFEFLPQMLMYVFTESFWVK